LALKALFIVTKPLGEQPPRIWGGALSAREHVVKGHLARLERFHPDWNPSYVLAGVPKRP